MIDDILTKAQNDFDLEPEDIAELLAVPLFSMDAGRLQAAARLKSRKASLNYAEVHACVGGQPSSPSGETKTGREMVKNLARQFEREGANAVYVGYCADEVFDDFIGLSREIRQALRPETVMVAAVGDFSETQAKALKDSGYKGVHLTIRFGATDDIARIGAWCDIARTADLLPGVCLEGVGKDAANDVLVSDMIMIRDAEPVVSAVARYDPMSAASMHEEERITAARLTHIMAVMRLTMYGDVSGVGMHDAGVVGAVAGANLIWATAVSSVLETESAPRRGLTVSAGREIFYDAEWRVFDKPSLCYGGTALEDLG